MLMKWLDGKCQVFFTPGNPALCFAACAYVRLGVKSEEQGSDYRLSLPSGATAKTQGHNNGWLFLPGKRWWWWWVLLRGWVGRGAGGVYLSHGNWFAGVEVGSFEKTSFGLTASHLSVWKAAGRKGGRLGRGGGGGEGVTLLLLLQRYFHTKGWRQWVTVWSLNLMPGLKWKMNKNAFFSYHLASPHV